jgi:hypothetical protein
MRFHPNRRLVGEYDIGKIIIGIIGFLAECQPGYSVLLFDQLTVFCPAFYPTQLFPGSLDGCLGDLEEKLSLQHFAKI